MKKLLIFTIEAEEQAEAVVSCGAIFVITLGGGAPAANSNADGGGACSTPTPQVPCGRAGFLPKQLPIKWAIFC